MDNYIGEIRLFAGNFAPEGWHFCDGSSLRVSEYQALYALIGNLYGGDQVSFNLPDLRGRVPVGIGQLAGGSNYTLGAKGGSNQVTLATGQMPAHNHTLQAYTTDATTGDPTGSKVFAKSKPQDSTYTDVKYYDTLPATQKGPDSVLNPLSVQPVGSGLAHNNMMPYGAINYIIALNGIFPTQA